MYKIVRVISKIFRAICKKCTMVCGICRAISKIVRVISKIFRAMCNICTVVCGIRRAMSNKIRGICKPIRVIYTIPAMMSKILKVIYQVQRTVCKMRRLLNYCENQRAQGCMILLINKQCSYKLQVKVPFTKWTCFLVK